MTIRLKDVDGFLLHLEQIHDRLEVHKRPEDESAAACNPRQLKALNVISRHGPIQMGGFAKLLKVPLSTASRIIDQLEDKQLLRRVPGKKDARITEITFSAEGEKIDNYIQAQKRQEAVDMLASLKDGEQQQFLVLLEALAANEN